MRVTAPYGKFASPGSRQQVGHGAMRRKVSQSESNACAKEEDLPSSATGSLESSLPAHARNCNSYDL